jgi:hypothetical protein
MADAGDEAGGAGQYLQSLLAEVSALNAALGVPLPTPAPSLADTHNFPPSHRVAWSADGDLSAMPLQMQAPAGRAVDEPDAQDYYEAEEEEEEYDPVDALFVPSSHARPAPARAARPPPSRMSAALQERMRAAEAAARRQKDYDELIAASEAAMRKKRQLAADGGSASGPAKAAAPAEPAALRRVAVAAPRPAARAEQPSASLAKATRTTTAPPAPSTAPVSTPPASARAPSSAPVPPASSQAIAARVSAALHAGLRRGKIARTASRGQGVLDKIKKASRPPSFLRGLELQREAARAAQATMGAAGTRAQAVPPVRASTHSRSCSQSRRSQHRAPCLRRALPKPSSPRSPRSPGRRGTQWSRCSRRVWRGHGPGTARKRTCTRAQGRERVPAVKRLKELVGWQPVRSARLCKRSRSAILHRTLFARPQTRGVAVEATPVTAPPDGLVTPDDPSLPFVLERQGIALRAVRARAAGRGTVGC